MAQKVKVFTQVVPALASPTEGAEYTMPFPFRGKLVSATYTPNEDMVGIANDNGDPSRALLVGNFAQTGAPAYRDDLFVGEVWPANIPHTLNLYDADSTTGTDTDVVTIRTVPFGVGSVDPGGVYTLNFLAGK